MPSNYVNGNYKVHVSLPAPMTSLYENPAYSMQLANTNTTWNTTKGYNYLVFDLNINSAYLAPNYSGSLWFDNCYRPLTWISFTAVLENQNVNLNWVTTREINAAYFVVEHSTDGIHFNVIQKIKNDNLSSQEVHYYNYTAQSPDTGSNYYRITEFDSDSNHTCCSIETVNVSSPRNYSISLNPFTEYTYLYYDPKNEVSIIVNIQDMQKAASYVPNPKYCQNCVNFLPTLNYLLHKQMLFHLKNAH